MLFSNKSTGASHRLYVSVTKLGPIRDLENAVHEDTQFLYDAKHKCPNEPSTKQQHQNLLDSDGVSMD